MATPKNDDTVKTTAAKKAPAAKKTVKKAAKKAASKTTAKKSAPKTEAPKVDARASANTSSSSSSTNERFSFDEIFGNKDKADKTSGPASSKADSSKTEEQHFNAFVDHAEKSLDEVVQAIDHGAQYAAKKLDALSIKAQRQAKELAEKGQELAEKGQEWVKEHPVVTSVISTAAASAIVSGAAKLFRRR